MDASKVSARHNPREKANIIAVLFWTWTLKFFKTGYTKELEPPDLYEPLKNDQSGVLGDRLEREWNKELKTCKESNKSPSLFRTIFRCFLWEYFLMALLQILNEFVLRLGTPILIGGLLHYFKDESDGSFKMAVMYATGICVATGINAITINQSIFGAFHIGGKIRIAVCSLVYRKALRLSVTALGETAPGKIVNLVANDVNRFDLVSVIIQFMWSAPLLGIIVGYFLYVEVGYAGIIGLTIVFIVVPIQSYTGKLSSKFRLQTSIKTDERVRLMDEIISGVQVIKMYAWEKPFCAMIALARRFELKVVRKSSYIRGIYMTFNLFTTRMAIYCTLVGMLFLGQPLSAEKVFVFASYFSILAHTMTAMFVRGVAELAECSVAVRRLQHFLMYDEYEVTENRSVSFNTTETKYTSKPELPYIDEEIRGLSEIKQNGSVCIPDDSEQNIVNCVTNQTSRSSNIAVSLKNLSAKWEPYRPENILADINVDMENGHLYIMIGAVGAGKSSLISAILGEMSITNGSIDIKGKISYASQEAWLFGSTIRQNILFGQTYDRQRYQKVVKTCALQSDFKQFPQGDQTIVGERGSSLSGGQKARINLARCVYRQADIYILDDPLSAVDTHVGKHLFRDCIQKYLIGKTRILATHQLQFIKGADAILLLENGKLKRFANYIELLAEHTEYATLLTADSSSEATEDSLHEISSIRRKLSANSIKSRTSDISGGDTDNEEDEHVDVAVNQVEGTSKGIIHGSIYTKYFSAGGNWCFVSIVGIFVLFAQVMATLSDLYYPLLVDVEEERHDMWLMNLKNLTDNSSNLDYPIEPAYPYLYVYTALVSLIFVIGIARSFLFYTLTIFASQRLHDQAFGALIRTGMRFFDTNSSGRILNRFSKDMGAIDELLPKALLDASQIILLMCGSLVIVCVVNPIFIAPLVVIVFIFYWIRKVYIKTSQNVKRLEGMLRSPVFTHLNATLNGLTTIRAYNAQEILKIEFDRFQDSHSSAWYMFIVISMAFGFSLDVFCFLFVTIVTFTLLFISGYSGSEVGLAITTIISLTGTLQWGMRQSAEIANQMMSVERVLEYTLLPPEENLSDKEQLKKSKKINRMERSAGQLEKSSTVAPNNWPSEGSIKFISLFMRYAEDDPPVLKGLNLLIKPREKVGIVGRTGAGKSSLITALFRLAKTDGVIEIDGVDTKSIQLEDLRKNISIIPQDPVLFSGTLRKNLDPFNEFTDDALWSVLEEVELKDAVVNGTNGLEGRIFDRGTNYSVGQRQLVCLARAILRNNKILMLDEATANVDPHTDALIQKTIRTKFEHCTVLTVAHRLNTIMDSDKVLVMDNGRLAEYDHPYVLLHNEYGQFTSLVKETGSDMYDQLFKVAKSTYDEKKRKQ